MDNSTTYIETDKTLHQKSQEMLLEVGEKLKSQENFTVRQAIATTAMEAIMKNPSILKDIYGGHPNVHVAANKFNIASCAVSIADELLRQLEGK